MSPTGDGAKTPRAVPLPAPAPGTVRPVSIERAVDEGLLIARAAVTMDAKNHIIVEAIREGHPFDLDDVVATVRRELMALARENAASAQRVQQLSIDVQTPRGAPDNSEGYQADDHPTLSKRGIIHVLLSSELERLSHDDEYVADIAERARLQAWSEVGDAIESRLLTSLPPEPDRFYDEDREARIRALYNINLRALEKRARREGHRPPE
ncbi:MAG: hypothetical protein WDM88_11385 [Galbitalea sp.]